MSCAPGTYWAGYEKRSAVLAPGTIDYTKVAVCKPCPRGQYQPNKGASECLSCPNATYTDYEGSNSVALCKGNLYHVKTYFKFLYRSLPS